MRNSELTGNLQLLQKFAVPGAAEGNTNPPKKYSPIYVGVQSHVSRVEAEEDKKEKKEKESTNGVKRKNKTKRLYDVWRMDCSWSSPQRSTVKKSVN